jgi:hypothetical protein
LYLPLRLLPVSRQLLRLLPLLPMLLQPLYLLVLLVFLLLLLLQQGYITLFHSPAACIFQDR